MSKRKFTRRMPSQKYLRECFDYDADGGQLRWKEDRPMEHFADANRHSIWKSRCAGKIAGNISPSTGYRELGLDGVTYSAARLVWKLMTGRDPSKTVDHKDGDRLNDRWNNLRLATDGQQKWNIGSHCKNTSGRRGVYLHNRLGRWVARINHERVKYHLGVFDTIEEASAAYERVARKFRGEFYREAD